MMGRSCLVFSFIDMLCYHYNVNNLIVVTNIDAFSLLQCPT